MNVQHTELPSNHLAVVERAYRQIFCPQLFEHRYNRICLYEKNSLLVNMVLPLLGKLVGHFSVPTPTTIMVCDVALALLNHQIKRGTLPLTRDAPFSTQPIADFIRKHAGTHLSFNTILCILEHGMTELLAGLEKSQSDHFMRAPNLATGKQNSTSSRTLWFVADRIQFFDFMVSKQLSINWEGRISNLVDAFGVVAGECIPKSVDSILLNGHAHVLAAYCAMVMDCTGVQPVVNGHHFASEKVISILSMIDAIVSGSRELLDNLPLPKGYVAAFRRCKLQCEKNLKVIRDRVRLGGGLHDKLSLQESAMQSLGIIENRIANSNYWEKDFRRTMLALDPFPDENWLNLDHTKHVQVLPRLCYGYVTWDDYLFRNYTCFKSDGSSRVAMDFLGETQNIIYESISNSYLSRSKNNRINMYGENSNIFRVLSFDPDFSHEISRGRSLKRYTVDMKIAADMKAFRHTDIPQHRANMHMVSVAAMDVEESNLNGNNIDIEGLGGNQGGATTKGAYGSAWTDEEVDDVGSVSNHQSGGIDSRKIASRHLFLIWNDFSSPNFCFRGCWFQRAKRVQQNHNSGNKFHQIIATIEVNEEFFHWYLQKTKNGEISSVPDGIYITNPKFGGYTSVLSVIESLSAPNKYTSARKHAYVDERVGAPPPKDATWPKVPTWIMNLIAGQKTDIYKTLQNLEAEIPSDIFNFSTQNSECIDYSLDGFLAANGRVLGTTPEEIQEGLERLYDNSSITFSNVNVFERTFKGVSEKDGYGTSVFVQNEINTKNTSTIVQKGISFDLAISKRAGFTLPVKVHRIETGNAYTRKLYAAQRSAVWSSILRKLTILIGPPGTGKTDTLLEIINLLSYNFCRKVRQRMLVVSHSNRALDQLYEAVVEFYKIESARLKASELWVPDMVRLGGAYNKSSRYDIVNADIVFMTCTGCAIRRFSMKWEFDIVIAEEAAKITQPEALPFLSYNPSRLILVGDHLQLSPVIVDPTIKERTWLEESLFQVLLRKGVPTVVLDYQGRSTPCICDMYRWRYPSLKDLPIIGQKKFKILDSILKSEIFPADMLQRFSETLSAIPPLFIDMDYTKFGENKAVEEKNRHEASFIKAFIDHILSDKATIKTGSISILTPYKNQKQYLQNDVLSDYNCNINGTTGEEAEGLDIATTDEYQGLQNDIVLVSLVSTSARPSPHLSNPKRLNVLTSRSRVMFVLIGTKKTFENSDEWKRVLSAFEFLSETSIRLYIDSRSQARKMVCAKSKALRGTDADTNDQHNTEAADITTSSFIVGNTDVKSAKKKSNILDMAQHYLLLISKYTDDNTSEERTKRILAMLLDVDLNAETLYNESIIKKRILDAEQICKSEMVEFGKIIYEKIIEERPNQSEERSRKILAMLLALDRKHRVRLVNAENDTNNHALLIQKIKEAESILPPVLHNHSVTAHNIDDGGNVLEGQKKKKLSPHMFGAAKILLPKIQLLAKNKSEQRIKKILAILLDMEEPQISLICKNEKVLHKRIKEAETILNDDHWTKRVRKVTLGED